MAKNKCKDCTICGLPGPTKCTVWANCLNISLEAELKAYPPVKVKSKKK